MPLIWTTVTPSFHCGASQCATADMVRPHETPDAGRLRLQSGEILPGRLGDALHLVIAVYRPGHHDRIAQAELFDQARLELRLSREARHDLDAHNADIQRLLQKLADPPPVHAGFVGDLGQRLVLLVRHAGDMHHEMLFGLVERQSDKIAMR